jgi:beta-glucosidase
MEKLSEWMHPFEVGDHKSMPTPMMRTRRPQRACRGLRALAVIGILALTGCGDHTVATSVAVQPTPTASPTGTPDPVEQADALLAQMTLDEKVALAASGKEGVPRLGIPPLVPSDGPNGVRGGGPGKTAFPNAQVVAASWDRALAERFGSALGAEAGGKGFNLVLGPTVNILRTPKWGRAAETLGEDPYLAGQIVSAEIRALQRQHVMAEVKHFAANNQETHRLGDSIGLARFSPAVNVIVSARALHEIYFPAFRAAVQDGQVASVMCSYPQINGLYACQNPAVLGALKDEWGFLGFVEPDALVAVRDPLAAALAGTDQFALGSAGTLPVDTALRRIPPQRLDDMVRRILTAMVSVGLFEHPTTGSPDAVVSTPEHLALAAEIGAQGSVLLKNDGHVLPLGAGVRTIAVVGYDAGRGTQSMEGGSPSVVGGPVITPLDAITARAGDAASVRYAAGTRGVVPLPILPADVLTPSAGTGSGLLGTYYADDDWSGAVVRTAVVRTLDTANILVSGARSARFTGTLSPVATGPYRFSLRYAGIVRLLVDGRLVASGASEGLDNPLLGVSGAPPITAQGVAQLTAGNPVAITVEYTIGPSYIGAALHLGWQPPEPPLVDDAVELAGVSDVAVVFVNDVTSEGMDRSSLALPGDQDALIAAVAAANPRTIVVLHTSGPVLMPWLSQVAAVIQAWYPGEQSGNAIAAVLFGDAEPAGRLPMTFPAGDEQGPGQEAAHYPGIDGVVHYDEDIYVGYRYFDQFGQEPLFPFGYGLSYTTFAVGDLRVAPRGAGTYDVTVTVTNTGSRRGAAVVQLYVGFPDAAAEPPNQLKGFGKVFVNPGQAEQLTMTLDESSFAVWSNDERTWVVHPGTYQLRVGTSLRDLPLRAELAIG